MSAINVWLSVCIGVALWVHFVVSVALAAIERLSPIALQRMGNEYGKKFLFVQRIGESNSSYRLAASLLQQSALLTALFLVGQFAQRLDLATPWIWSFAGGTLVAVLLSDHLLARAVSSWNPRGALRHSAFLMRLARLIFWPIVIPLRAGLNWAGADRQSEEQREEEQDDEVEALLEVGERAGLLEAQESEMVRGIVDLDETVVRELMTPRTEIVGVDVSTPVRDARRLILEAGHSRLPAFSGSIDNVLGVLHTRDLFRAWDDGDEERAIRDYIRPAKFVPETLSAAELLSEMRQHTHMALVVDEYGGVAGLVSLEDLLEEIVGDIRDEHDEEEDLMREASPGVWVVNAVVHVKEIEQRFDVEFADRDYDTVGGLVVAAFARVPHAGERIVTAGLDIEVLQSDRKRVQMVKICAQSAAQDGAA